MVDYTNTSHAQARRATKARHVARLLYHDGLAAADIAHLTDRARRAAANDAGQRPLSETTWAEVAHLLAAMAQWAHTHPGHPAATAATPHRRHRWITPDQPPPAHGTPPAAADDTPLF